MPDRVRVPLRGDKAYSEDRFVCEVEAVHGYDVARRRFLVENEHGDFFEVEEVTSRFAERGDTWESCHGREPLELEDEREWRAQ